MLMFVPRAFVSLAVLSRAVDAVPVERRHTLDTLDRSTVLLQTKSLKRSVAVSDEGASCPQGWKEYHTTHEVLQCIKLLSKQGSCRVPLVAEHVYDRQEQNKSLLAARLGNPSAAKHVLIAANEHARELITGEIALRFIERVCAGDQRLLKIFDEVRVTLFAVMNEKGRALAETDDPCQRNTVNEEGRVDLNRNADVDFSPEGDHGNEPFSMYQTRILRDAARLDPAVAYIDLHSGAEALMTPWGFKAGVSPDFEAQQQMLTEIQREFCPDCTIGSNRLVIGYENPGEIIDHMYARQRIKHTSLWEVFVRQGVGFSCRTRFNPEKTELDAVSKKWASALIRAVEYVHVNVSSEERSVENASDYPALLQVGTSERLNTGRPSRDELTT